MESAKGLLGWDLKVQAGDHCSSWLSALTHDTTALNRVLLLSNITIKPIYNL